MSALSDPQVGELVKQHYVATLERVGGFAVSRKEHRHKEYDAKVGGNVVTYLCTPDGRVLHFLVGPVGAKVLRESLSWAAAVYARAKDEAGDDQQRLARLIDEEHAQQVDREALEVYEREFAVAMSRPAIVVHPSGNSDQDVDSAPDDSALLRNVSFEVPAASAHVGVILRAARLGRGESALQLYHAALSKLHLPELQQIEASVFEILADQDFARRDKQSDEILARVKDSQAEGRMTLLIVNSLDNPRKLGNLVIAATRATPRLLSGEERTPAEAQAAEKLAKYKDRVGVIELSSHKLTTLLDDLGREPVSTTDWRVPQFVLLDAQGKERFVYSDNVPLNNVIMAVHKELGVMKHYSPEKIEQLAMNRLQMAKTLMQRNPDTGVRWLEKTIDEFPDSRAAAQARQLLAATK